MTGETDLAKLLQDLKPELSSDDFVFVSIAPEQLTESLILDAKCMYREVEGVTLVMTADALRRHKTEGLDCESAAPSYKCITCKVHSSLEAVGMTAAIASVLATSGISANVVAAYYHDHIFVPSERAEEACRLLTSLGTMELHL